MQLILNPFLGTGAAGKLVRPQTDDAQPQQQHQPMTGGAALKPAVRRGFQAGQRNRNTKPATYLADFVSIICVTLEAGLVCDKRTHQTHEASSTRLLDLADLFGALFESKQALAFPGIRAVFRPNRLQTGQVTASDKLALTCHFVDLAGHISRVQHGQLATGRGSDIPTRNMG